MSSNKSNKQKLARAWPYSREQNSQCKCKPQKSKTNGTQWQTSKHKDNQTNEKMQMHDNQTTTSTNDCLHTHTHTHTQTDTTAIVWPVKLCNEPTKFPNFLKIKYFQIVDQSDPSIFCHFRELIDTIVTTHTPNIVNFKIFFPDGNTRYEHQTKTRYNYFRWSFMI